MATIKMVITAIGTIGSNPAVGVDYSSVVPVAGQAYQTRR